MRSLLLLGCLSFWGSAFPAAASGGFECSINGKSFEFTVSSGVTRGMGGPTFNLRGELKMLGNTVAEDFRTVVLDDGNRPQYWLDDKELRLIFYREREGESDKPFASVELEIRTKATKDDTGTYTGAYKLTADNVDATASTVGTGVVHEGEVSCSVE